MKFINFFIITFDFFKVMFEVWISLWPLFLAAVLWQLILRIPELFLNYRAKKSGVTDTDHMSGREFEIYLKNLFEKAGCKVRLLQGYKDHGADLIVTDKRNKRYAVQAKKLKSGRVGAKVIGEPLRAMNYYKCDVAMIVTNQNFTKQAKEEAKIANVVLWNREELIKISEKLKNKR